jgi:hypothetical protein
MQLKLNDTNYSNISSIYYNSNIAPPSMNDEITKLYLFSNNNLKHLSELLEHKYGMHIAASTISVNARKYLSSKGMIFRNRKDAKKYFTQNNYELGLT